ncbi:sigma-70 family RNA polymerase sigma factor [Luteolibacter sp. GHJ8]|uniref:Sigma-70 family RNA polymerase sigma factor n=1 Tax=Luteolibacter rhizosphaerae TaxID=2989719 RepID=A0ABT3GCF3_9BACT|nr:sigma-70 family RNA polymerase sigma factor [Luteolibacter rhizosphaerae]MCW1916895.1 sigma-70 family RNA polymerase sigma factor [Luteolibacter rhizosphaerae]
MSRESACDDAMEVLVRQVQQRGPGWMEAFGQLVRHHEGWVRGFLRSRIRDWAAADDLAQDVFVTAFKRVKAYRGESSFEGWLRGIAVNHLRNFVRKRREQCIGGSEELQVLIDRGTEAFLGDAEESDALEALHKCLARIDGPSRELLTERYVSGKTVREISAASGRGYSALTMQLHRLRDALAACVARKLEVPEA